MQQIEPDLNDMQREVMAGLAQIATRVFAIDEIAEDMMPPNIMSAAIQEFGIFRSEDDPELIIWAVFQEMLRAALNYSPS